MSPDFARWAMVAVYVGALAIAGLSDLMRRKIPNWTVLVLAAAWIAALLAHVAPSSLASGLGAAAITFAVTYLLYHFDVFGAGDAKLFSVTALFAGMGNLLAFGFLSVMIGGAMAVGVIVFRPKRVMRAMTTRGREQEGLSGIPYGVAIAIGGIVTAALTPGFFPKIS